MSRSPLYRLERFAASVDTDLLLGKQVGPDAFNNTTLGRALDAIYEHGAGQLFSQVALAAAAAFPAEVDLRHLHFDTNSVSVWGAYAAREHDDEPSGAEALSVAFGHSKDRRPDLKQFLLLASACPPTSARESLRATVAQAILDARPGPPPRRRKQCGPSGEGRQGDRCGR